jgi:hypothetical protein
MTSLRRAIRAALVLGLLAALGALTSAPAGAQSNGCGNGSSWVQCGGGGGTVDGGGGGTGVSISVDFALYFDEDGTGVDSEEGYETGCWGIQVVPEGEGGTWAEAVAEQEAQGENGVLWGNCEVEDTIDPAALAAQLWQRQVRPPPPTPLAVDPGKALAGLRAYLEIGGEVPATQTIQTPIGPATFVMTPRYVVSWGDGETTSTSSQGGPYPDGDVTHVYQVAEDLTLTVDAYWRTTWTLAGQGGDLPELAVPTSGSLDLTIEERQAVTD